MHSFLIALQFLTRLSPVHQEIWTEQDFGASVKTFPLVGAVLGLIYFCVSFALCIAVPFFDIPFPKHMTMAILLAMPILLTGGLFCDGFMDTMDGIFSGRDKEKMLTIMKDSRVGSNGVFAFVLLMIFQYGILLDFFDEKFLEILPCQAMFVMPIVARLMVVYEIKKCPLARQTGLGKMFADFSEKNALTIATIFTLILLIPFGWLGYASLLVCFCFTKLFAHYVTKKIGGVTGDIYGATATICECLVLLVFFVGRHFV